MNLKETIKVMEEQELVVYRYMEGGGIFPIMVVEFKKEVEDA